MPPDGISSVACFCLGSISPTAFSLKHVMMSFGCKSGFSFAVTPVLWVNVFVAVTNLLIVIAFFILKQNRSIQQLEKDLENYKLKKESVDVSKLIIYYKASGNDALFVIMY